MTAIRLPTGGIEQIFAEWVIESFQAEEECSYDNGAVGLGRALYILVGHTVFYDEVREQKDKTIKEFELSRYLDITMLFNKAVIDYGIYIREKVEKALCV